MPNTDSIYSSRRGINSNPFDLDENDDEFESTLNKPLSPPFHDED